MSELPLVLVVGTGSIGSRHLRVLQEVGGVEPVAISMRPERQHELETAGFRVAASIEDGLALRPLAAVIATDTGRHFSDAAKCLDAGCHLLIEKPVTVRASDARELVRRAGVADRELVVGCCLRFDRGLRWMRERLAALGRIVFADVECLSYLPSWRPGRNPADGYAARADEGGVIRDLVHELDYVSWFLGPAVAVSASSENNGWAGIPKEVDESAWLSLQHEGGRTSSVRLSYAVRPTSRTFRVWGEHGMLSWDRVKKCASRVNLEGETMEEFSFAGTETIYHDQARHFLASIRGEPSAWKHATGEEAAHIVALCEAAHRSAQRKSVWENIV